jgi:hypothetical protein
MNFRTISSGYEVVPMPASADDCGRRDHMTTEREPRPRRQEITTLRPGDDPRTSHWQGFSSYDGRGVTEGVVRYDTEPKPANERTLRKHPDWKSDDFVLDRVRERIGFEQ